MLYLVATPIGNLQDITFRAVEILQSCDYILCEDTRRTAILLNHFKIKKPLKAYHKFNESAKENPILEDLREGKSIALVSDAGTPGISDPGAKLVQVCVDHKIKVCAIPGPCAAIAALTCSGLSTDRFTFYGFLPRKAGELNAALQEILSYAQTTICYESPHRIRNVLEIIHSIDPLRKVVIARELTKKFEEVINGTASELIKNWEGKDIKGEIVLLIDRAISIKEEIWNLLSIEEHVDLIQNTYSLSRMQAMKIAGSLRGLSKRQVYQSLHVKEIELKE